VIGPMVKAHPGVEYVGEIADQQKSAFLGGAAALLFPIDWEEPFGLVMIEAMACGTPVIAFRRGSVPEVVENGMSGYIVDTVDEAVAAAARIGDISRGDVRGRFDTRFTVERMARDYVEAYGRLIGAATRVAPVIKSEPRALAV
jgi:glycosyltransferase involved in cell wall biosynthesis